MKPIRNANYKQKKHLNIKSFSLKLLLSFFWVAFFLVSAPLGEANSQNSGKGTKLFSAPAPGSKTTYEKKAFDPTIIREKVIQVNFGLLTDHDYLAEKNAVAKSLELNFFNEVSFIVENTKVDVRKTDDYSWFGKTAGNEYSDVLIVVKEDIISGYVFTLGKQYQVRTPEKGVYVVREVDTSAFPECGNDDVDHGPHPLTKPGSSETFPAGPSSSNESGSIIDVMILYTQAAAQASADIATDVQGAVDLTNLAFSNSKLAQRVRLVHSEQVNLQDGLSTNSAFDALKDPTDGYIDHVHSLRNTYGADLVSLIVENTASGVGLGSRLLPGHVDGTYSNGRDQAWSVVTRTSAVANHSIPHEFGHNLGGNHDRNTGCGGPSNYPYNCGYIDPQKRWRTIMAYWTNNCNSATT